VSGRLITARYVEGLYLFPFASGDLGVFPELKEHRRLVLIAALGCYIAGVTA
jgi:hypothetical protein